MSTDDHAMENYSICLFRIPKEGGRAIWEVTKRCNYSCGYCIFSGNINETLGELTSEECGSVLADLKAHGFSHVKYTGGEPFIKKGIMGLLRKTAEMGFVWDISTNGSLITDDTAAELRELSPEMVHTSIDGYNRETHELARGAGTFEPTIRGARYLVNNGLYVRVGSLIFKGNESKLEDIIQLAASLGAKEIIFSYMEAAGRMAGDNSLISTRPVSEVKDELGELSEEYAGKIKVNFRFTSEAQNSGTGTCPGLKKWLFIDNLGQVAPCTWVVESMPEYRSIATLKHSKLDDVLRSEQVRAFLEMMDAKKVKECPVRRR